MKLPNIEGKPGDTAVYIKDNGLCSLYFICYEDNEWFIEKFVGGGDWHFSFDFSELLEGKLVFHNNKPIKS